MFTEIVHAECQRCSYTATATSANKIAALKNWTGMLW